MRMALIPSLGTASPAYFYFASECAENELFCQAVAQQKAKEVAWVCNLAGGVKALRVEEGVHGRPISSDD
jgi:hypothetical protein